MANEDPRYGDVSGNFTQVGSAMPRPWGRYVLLHALAQGGMGAIFIAKYAGSAGFERYCVIKTLRRQFTEDTDAVARFLDEARVVAQLQHTNICSVFDVGQVDGRYYLAMDYIAGFDAHALQRRCQQVGAPLPPGILFYIVGEMLDALDYAHRALSPTTGTSLGIVHRDISPNNIMISFEGEVKLIDFGLALSSLKNQRTEPTLLVGKVAYMAPEQATGDPVDARADQFAAAVVLYELLTGEDFYAGIENKQAIWTRAALGDHRPPSYLRIDPALRAILDRALARDRNARFPSCDELRQALDAYAWGGGWRASKAELRKLMAERFSLEMTTHRRLLFGFTDVHVAPTLDVVGVAAESPLPEHHGRPEAPVPVVVGEASERSKVPAANSPHVPAAVSLADGAPMTGPPAPGTTAGMVPAPVTAPRAPPPPAPPLAGPAPSLAAPFREAPSSRPALVAVGPRPLTAAVADALRAPKEPDLDLEPPAALVMVPGEPSPLLAASPELPAVPHTDVVRRRDGNGAGRARRRALVLLLVATVAGTAFVSRAELRRQLEPRGLWPAFLDRLEPASTDAGVAQEAVDDAGVALVLVVTPDAGAAAAPDAGAAAAPDAGAAAAPDAGAAAARDAGAAVEVDAGEPPSAMPAPTKDASSARKLAWLQASCPTLRCVSDATGLLEKKRPTRAQRAAAERAVDRCVLRCSAAGPAPGK